MSIISRLFICGITLLALSSCGTTPQITKGSLIEIHRGMSPKDCRAELHAEPKLQFVVNHDEAPFSIEIYDMETRVIASPTYNYMPSQWGGVIMQGATYSGVYSDYVFVYDKDGLIYWGFMDDLHKAYEKLIRELSPQIFLERERALKKSSGTPPSTQDYKELPASKHSDEMDDQVGKS
jgi:hypothetical protein